MLDRVLEVWPEGKRIALEASEALGRDLLSLYRKPESFEKNRDIQVGVFLATHLHLGAIEAAGVQAELSLGLSLGEVNHLVHIGTLSFLDALALVDARGSVYDRGPRGMMVVLFPADLEMVVELVERARSFGTVEIANLNSPTQFVVAGETRAVTEVMRMAEEDYMLEPVVIDRQIPMHTSVFRSVAEELLPHLRARSWNQPRRPYISNVLGAFVDAPTPEIFIQLLERHVYSPVRWRDAIDAVVGRYPEAVFVEVGPRGVLYNLLQKRWHACKKYKTDKPEGSALNFQDLANALGGLSSGLPAEGCHA
jgi:[acyl-carrier-protein] S-malonyltransferase